MTWRLSKLNVGLVLFGVGTWLGLQAHLGVGPWDVLAGGLAGELGTPFGRTAIGISVAVLVVCLCVGVRPGLGTLLNVIVIGAVVDILLATPALDSLRHQGLIVRLLGTAGGIASVAAGSALYLGAHLGAGPRDGLMVALAERTGWAMGVSRALLELTVLVGGVALGGPVGPGTVAFAVGIGPAVQLAFTVLRQEPVRRVVESPP